MKSGPNGPALRTSLHDLALLPPQLISSLKILGGPVFSNHVDRLLAVSDRVYGGLMRLF